MLYTIKINTLLLLCSRYVAWILDLWRDLWYTFVFI